MFAYDEDLASKVFARIPKIARAVRASNPTIKGMNVLNNNGTVAYQSVFHSHFHLIPRYTDDDDFKMVFKDNSANYTPADYQKKFNNQSLTTWRFNMKNPLNSIKGLISDSKKLGVASKNFAASVTKLEEAITQTQPQLDEMQKKSMNLISKHNHALIKLKNYRLKCKQRLID